MNNSEILSHIDHTLLRPTATWPEIRDLCDEAARAGTASVCIPPCYVARVRTAYPEQNICTVIGFPLGYMSTAAKVAEAADAVGNGANEIDMVINLCDVKNGDFAAVTAEIAAVRAVSQGVLKVIVETCYLTEKEKMALCRCVTEAGADYIKTSTGFGTGGAAVADIRLFRQQIGKGVRIKASGGIRTREDMVRFLVEGCDRLGTSSAGILLQSGAGGDGY